jgi:hypothetical protein
MVEVQSGWERDGALVGERLGTMPLWLAIDGRRGTGKSNPASALRTGEASPESVRWGRTGEVADTLTNLG